MIIVILIITALILTSHSNSQGWVQQTSGAFMTNFYEVQMLNSNTVFVAGYFPDIFGWVYRTTNAGVNWSVSYTTQNPLNQIRSVSFSSANTGTACGGGLFNGSFVIRTINGGANWTTLSTGTNFYHMDVQMIDGNTAYLVGQSGSILKTTDGGGSWNPQTSTTTRRLYALSFFNASIGMAVGDTGVIVKTTNSGTNWNALTSGTTQTLYNVAMLNTNDAIAVGVLGTLLKTTNGGVNWVPLSSGVTQTLRGISYINANLCYVVGDGGLIRRTTNGGTNWTSQNSTLTQILHGISFIDTSTGTAVGDNGKIIRTTNGGITFIQPVSNEIPEEFLLSQNYPNPFNPTTNFEFRIAASVLVRLTVYDVLGREIATIVNEELAPGTYQANWDASNYSSGIFFYKLVVRQAGSTTGDFSQTKKMILLK
jgi:photosystem II stability/assembly factor-like uncharacterized protein